MELKNYTLDLLLVPFGLCITVGYHVFLWFRFKKMHPFGVTVGANKVRRRIWSLNIIRDHEKNGMLGVQSLRNSLMTSILAASSAVILNTALAALTNNAFNASRFLHDSHIYGSQAGHTIPLKYASSSLLLLISFLCSSMGVVQLVEAGFLLNVPHEFSPEFVQAVIERGWVLASAGARVLFATVPLLLWVVGPVPMIISSMVLVWVLYQLDFISNGFVEDSPICSNVCVSNGH